jgi:hypothetical protein
MFPNRLLRARVLETLERRSRQFRTREDLWPFRVPHEPLELEAIVDEALAEDAGRFDADTLRSRTVMQLSWHGGGLWDAWVIALPGGITVYCDGDGEETRVLASVRRGSQAEADRMFLGLLAESAGLHFGIELAGDPPDRVRTGITEREFLIDFFVELFEGTPAEHALRGALASSNAPPPSPEPTVAGSDFRTDVDRWLRSALRQP